MFVFKTSVLRESVFNGTGDHRRSRERRVSTWVAICGCLASFAFLGSCASSDSSSDAPTDTSTDTSADTVSDVMLDVDSHDGELNGCGGASVLMFQDAEVELGVACGAFGEGIIVCASLETVRCVGESERNACGSRGVLSVTLGDTCGPCDDGVWACAEDGETACLGAREPNACGGCAALSGRPGSVCAGVDGDGTWICASRDTMECRRGHTNACGGTGGLTWESVASVPGETCDTPCGVADGVLGCDGEEALACVPTARAVPENACGGCGALPGRLDESCGVCGAGVWRCMDGAGEMVCDAAEHVDACGGCVAEAHVLGTSCGGERLWMCDGSTLACAEPVDPSLRNACNGTSPLEHEAGSACGTCDNGTWVCETRDELRCTDAYAGNACGGCERTPGEPGDACGVCGTGALSCDGTRLICVGDVGDPARNACGGCGPLDEVEGEECGTCLSWMCTATGGLRCAADSDLDGCGDLVTCETLHCDRAHRACEASDGVADARCGDCLTGYAAELGVCVLALPAPTGVTASQGTSGSYVEVTWAHVEGATGYHVYRDGARITATPVVEPPYVDAGAPTGGVPDEVLGLRATTDQFDEVVLSWNEGVSPAGENVSYALRAIAGERQSVLSSEAPGSRGPQWIMGYEVQVDGGPWELVGSQTSWTDVAAPEGVLWVSHPTATTTHSDRVEISAEEVSAAEGASRSYRVRAVNAAGAGAPSGHVEGNRDVGSPSFAWAWSTEIDGVFMALSGATSRTWTDTEVAAGESRWYRLEVSAAGTSPVTSSVVEGRSPLRCADLAAICASQHRTCSEGSGSEDAVCALCLDGFEEIVGACARLDCGALSSPENGSVSFETTTFASVATYACDEGYVITGNEERSCLSDGAWSGEPAACNGLGSACETDGACPSGAWCPTDTHERRCSPRPSFGGVEMPFQWVPRGAFMMGSPSEEVDRHSDEDQVFVELTRDYFVQRTPVTQAQWEAVAEAWNALPTDQRTMSGWSGATPLFNTTPSTAGIHPNLPVETVNWWEIVVFANALSILEGLDPCYRFTQCATSIAGGCSDAYFVGKTCTGYRLPTEAEWERAARGGTTTATYGGDLGDYLIQSCVSLTGAGDFQPGVRLAELAMNYCNCGSLTREVGQRAPNAWGLYDVLGNVWEYTWNWYMRDHVGGVDPLGPTARPSSLTGRVLRGGSCVSLWRQTRAAVRERGTIHHITYGFRLVRTSHL